MERTKNSPNRPEINDKQVDALKQKLLDKKSGKRLILSYQDFFKLFEKIRGCLYLRKCLNKF